MITKSEFESVQRLLKRDIIKPTRTKTEFAFNGLMTCGYCGRAVCGDRKRKVIKDSGEVRFHTYYACSRGSRCNPHRIKEKDVYEMIAVRLSDITLPEEYLQYAREATKRYKAEVTKLKAAVGESLLRTRTSIDLQMDELIALRSRRQIGDAEFDRLHDKLRDEKAMLAVRDDEERRQEEYGWEAANRLAEFCVTADATFRVGTLAQRGLIARQLGVSYILKRGELSITENGLTGLVRAHKKRASSLFAPLEPVINRSGSGKTIPFVVLYMRWGDLFTESRTKSNVSEEYPMTLQA